MLELFTKRKVILLILTSQRTLTYLKPHIMIAEFQTIEKERIESLHFPKEEVLQDRSEIRERESELNRALSLGNLEHTKTRIFFEDDESLKVVETTVWGMTDDRIILKTGSSIPIHRIYRSA